MDDCSLFRREERRKKKGWRGEKERQKGTEREPREKGKRKYRHEIQKVNMEMERVGEHSLKSYEARKIRTNKRPLDS